jgi:transmembrane sensor
MPTTAPAISDDVLDQATAWIARLRSDHASAADRQAFSAWLMADVAHAAAFDRMLELWSDLGVMRALPLALPQRAARNWRWQLPMALTASAFLLLVLLFPRETAQAPVELRTAVGSVHNARLEDGSELLLNTATRLRVTLSQHERRVDIDAGEAFFRVSHDAARPFSAHCGNAKATVLGTAFSVRCEQGSMQVTVEEGLVRLGSASAQAPSQLLRAGQACALHRSNGLSDVSVVDTASALAWREQRLVFNDAPLSSVIAELQRYMEPSLRIVDNAAAGIRVSGVFSTAQPQGALQALEQSLGIVIKGPESGPLLISLAAD